MQQHMRVEYQRYIACTVFVLPPQENSVRSVFLSPPLSFIRLLFLGFIRLRPTIWLPSPLSQAARLAAQLQQQHDAWTDGVAHAPPPPPAARAAGQLSPEQRDVRRLSTTADRTGSAQVITPTLSKSTIYCPLNPKQQAT
jgi:hypothetical protein